ncbi:MAG: hypothetical protein ACLQVG_29845 [Terriglobia bacterium]
MYPTKKVALLFGITAIALLYCIPQLAAQDSSDQSTATVRKSANKKDPEGAGKVGVGFRVSTLGLGGEAAYQLTHSSNIRGGVNYFSYSRGFDNNGINYNGDLRWLSGEAHYDWFPFSHVVRTFHLSPGVIFYNGNRVTATASSAGGNTFTLNHVTYQSNPADPVGGTGTLAFNKAAPTFMFGFGNLVPRNCKHFSANIEAGVAFQGSPKIGLNLSGSGCVPGTDNCVNVATDPTVQSNVHGEQTILSNDLSPFKYYPIIALTFGYRF